MGGITLIGGITPPVKDNDFMPIISAGHPGNALPRPGTTAGNGTLSTGRCEYSYRCEVAENGTPTLSDGVPAPYVEG